MGGGRFPRLYLVVDVDAARQAGWPPRDLARAYLDGGATLVQLRAKQLASGAFLALCDDVVRLASGYDGARVLVNDRADVARLSLAAGVHVGQTDLDPAGARRLVGDSAVVGLSTHTEAQIEAAVRQPVDYIAVGPVFSTTTKATGFSAVGLGLVASAARMAGRLPVVAIGGITLDTAWSVIEAGASSVAVITDALAGGDPVGRTRTFLQVLSRHRV